MSDFSFIRRLSQFGTFLHTRFHGVLAGTDEFGNRYYRSRRSEKGVREERWVIYAGEPEASKVPPEWHIWLHHTAEVPLSTGTRRPWQKPHQPNLTGTTSAYLPPGHTLASGKRPRATGDYEAWKPES